MKHILNNLSAEEKNSILEQHTGGMKVMTENFSKLLNSKLGDSKPLVEEETSTPKTNVMGTPNFQSKFGVKYSNVIPGDNTYVYAKCNGKWFAHNLKTTKETDLSSNPKFASSVIKLEKQFPKANNCIK